MGLLLAHTPNVSLPPQLTVPANASEMVLSAACKKVRMK